MPLSLSTRLARLAQFSIVAALVGLGVWSAAEARGSWRGTLAVAAGLATLVALLLIWAGWRRLIAFPADEYGPLPDDRERYGRYLRRIRAVDRERVERWKVQRRLRDAIGRALEATDLERAQKHLDRAREIHRQWGEGFRPPRSERLALERRFARDVEMARSSKHLNTIRAKLEHAAGLKSEAGRRRARAQARELLERALEDPESDHERLREWGRGAGLLTDLAWIPPGRSATVGGREVPGPLWVGGDEESALDPGQREAFLDWLASDREGEAPIAFPRRILGGIERRILGEGGPGGGEIPRLLVELERIAARHRPLRAKARELILFTSLRHADDAAAEGPGPLGAADGILPARIRLGLARLLAARAPLPAAWARAWLHHARAGELRAPARRCPEDFERLFGLRYRERFGAGLVVPPKPGVLQATYRPLSPTLEGQSFDARLDLPDPEEHPEAVEELEALAERCCEELGGLSRYLGRSEGRPPDLRALATLPAELLAWHDEPVLEELRTLVRDAQEKGWPALFDTARLAALWPKMGPLARGDCTRYATLLGKLGVGVEPDPRFGAPPWPTGGQLALFALASDAPRTPSRAYTAAALVVHVAVALAAAEEEPLLGDGEEEGLRGHLEASLDLPAAERRRLEVHLTWLRRHPPPLGGLRRRVERLDERGRERLADFLLRIACADGVVSPGEVKVLERLYALLGRDPERLHRDLHGRHTGSTPAATGSGLALDPARLAQKLAETRRVSALLGDIFQEEEPEAPASETPEIPAVTYAGLDPAHSAFLERLAERATWPREAVEDLAGELGLLTDGALDTLNDEAFAELGEPLWEGDDPLDLFPEVARELMGSA